MAENKELTQEQKEQFQNLLKTMKENQKKFSEMLKKSMDKNKFEKAGESPKSTAKKKRTTKK